MQEIVILVLYIVALLCVNNLEDSFYMKRSSEFCESSYS